MIITKKTPYQQSHEDIAAIIAELKSRKGWTDKEIGSYIGENGIKAGSVRQKRDRREFPKIRFCDLALLFDLAGYDIRFVKRGQHG